MQSKVYKKKTWKQRVLGTTIYQKILRVYLCITLIGAGILTLPASHASGKSLNFFEAFFTAISAFTNTGLTIKPTYEIFNFFGQFIILILIQVGGMGFLTFLIFLWVLFRKKKKITMEHRLFLHWERGSCNKVESLDAVKTGIAVLLIAEIIGAYVLTIFFYSSSPSSPSSPSSTSQSGEVVVTKGDFWKSLWYGIFHAVSAANNAGFDLLGKHSLIPYRNGANNFLSVVFLLESILGGIGYPIFHEIKNYFKAKKSGEAPEFSLFFKIGIVSYFLIALLGAFAAVCFEFVGSNSGIFKGSSSSSSSFTWDTNSVKAYADKVWNIIYLSFSSRSAGFTTINIAELTESTRWLFSVLMFIGANPASTGGGVRTVTMFIIFARFLYTAKGRKHLSIFQKTISQKIVDDALQVFILSIILVVFASFVLILSASGGGTMNDAIFEASSAFGTAGFTSGLTEKTNFVGQIALIVLMFVGQLGVSNALISITDLKSKPKDCEYLSADLRIM